MPVRPTIQLARVFGIRIGVGLSWFFVLFLYIFLFSHIFQRVLGGPYTATYLVTVASVLSFFVSLVLHELGHALAARRNGLGVVGIELWALGGITRTTGAPETPGAQFRVAAAGPAVTLAVIAAALAGGELLVAPHHFLAVVELREGVHTTPLALWLSWVLLLNVVVLALNLVPAFPLDGSQIAQAILWRLTGDRNGAARITGRIGQGFAVALGVVGAFLLSYGYSIEALCLMVVAVFLYQGAGQAVMHGAVGQRIHRLKVADIMDRQPAVIPGELRLLDAQEQFFGGQLGGQRRQWFAVVDQARHFLGVVRSERLDQEIAAGRPALSVSEVVEGAGDTQVQVDEDQPLETLLRSQALGQWGGVVAVDDDGVLRGVVTIAQIRRALRVAAGQ